MASFVVLGRLYVLMNILISSLLFFNSLVYPSPTTSFSACTNESTPCLPGKPVTDYFKTMKFSEGYSNLWGAQHQHISQDQSTVTLLLDRYSGSGFKSKEAYMYGFFNAAIKLQAGYTAGVLTSFYLSNSEVYTGKHDEVDIEFLGTIPGEPYTLQTNVYGNGTGDGAHLIGREQQFHLWFDPTQNFHNYSILWTPHHILFFVDSIPIRWFPKVQSLGVTYPSKPMSVYATIWDASAWATDAGKYKADYSYEPFLGTYTDFMISGCSERDMECWHGFLDTFIPPNLNGPLRDTLRFVRKNYMTYDYCQDFQRYPKGMPECPPAVDKTLDESTILLLGEIQYDNAEYQ